jgi:hypothetical protein
MLDQTWAFEKLVVELDILSKAKNLRSTRF